MDTDISKLVSMIMENPTLIEEIKNMAKTQNAEDTAPEASAEPEPRDTYDGDKVRRRQLLCALKPYLSSERAKAIDSMMSISDILEIARKK